MQIGWSTLMTPFTEHNGVGDDETSFAYDGHRVKKWNLSQTDYGQSWQEGDIIGTMIDFENKEIKFWRNDKCLGVAFKDIPVGPVSIFF